MAVDVSIEPADDGLSIDRSSKNLDAEGEAALLNGVRLGNLGEDFQNYGDTSYCSKIPNWTRNATFSSPNLFFLRQITVSTRTIH